MTHCAEILNPREVLTMGANVTRGSSKYGLFSTLISAYREAAFFNALNVQINWDWHESGLVSSSFLPSGNAYSLSTRSASSTSHPQEVLTSRNTFSADYSEEERYDDPSSEILGDQDEDDYEIYEVNRRVAEPGGDDDDDDDVQIVHDSIREPSVEIVMPPTSTFTVPESDDGSPRGTWVSGEEEDEDEEDDDLLFSEDSLTDEESPSSSPTTKKPEEEKPAGNLAVATSIPILDALFADRTTTNLSQRKGHEPIDMTEKARFDSDEACDGESYAEDELDHEYSDPPEQVDVPTTQAENLETNDIGIFTSAKVSHAQARPPSPSDAAMAKPSAEPSSSTTSGAPPFSPYYNPLLYRQSSLAVDNPTVSGRSSSAWAGHNSVLYETVPRPSMQEPQAPSQQPALYYPDCVLPASYNPAFKSQDSSVLASAPPVSYMSIASLVQPQQLQDESDKSKKRKADQISSDTFDSNQSHPDYLSNMLTCGTGVLDAGLPKVPNSSIEVAATALTNSIEIQPRKKVKKTHTKAEGLPRSSFVKMTAATIAGMAIGAVGTIIGLAALPQDYFA